MSDQQQDKNADLFYRQMEDRLKKQIEKCNYYKKFFDEAQNLTMANKFSTYALNSSKDLELLKMTYATSKTLPKHEIELISLTCAPINLDVKEKEVQIEVFTKDQSDTPMDFKNVYIIGEFGFPHPEEETVSEAFSRWCRYTNIDIRNITSCWTTAANAKQLDMVHSIGVTPNFLNPISVHVEYSRPLTFFIGKSKSKTLKRKFKLAKITFYEKASVLSMDKKIGSIQVKIDDINDELTISKTYNVMNGRKQTDIVADIKIRVREPLVEKSIRAHDEKILVLVSKT